MLHRKNLRECVSRLVSGTSALLTFPASWASKIVPCFLGKRAVPSFSCPHRVFEGLQREAADQVLQAVKFTDKNAPGLSLALEQLLCRSHPRVHPGLEDLKAMEIGENNVTKKVPVLVLKRKKKRTRKNGPLSSRFQPQRCC